MSWNFKRRAKIPATQAIGLFAQHSEARRQVILRKLMAATGAVKVGCADRSEAGATIRSELVVALRAEMKIAEDVRAAGRAA